MKKQKQKADRRRKGRERLKKLLKISPKQRKEQWQKQQFKNKYCDNKSFWIKN